MRFTHVLHCVQPVLVSPGGDDRPVISLRSVEIVVVGVEPRCFEPLRLRFAEHSERAANFDAQGGDLPHHFEDANELRVVPRLPPGGAQADAADSVFFCPARHLDHCFLVHQRPRLDASLVARGLRAISAVFRTAAGFDRNQFAHLHLVAVVIAAMDAGGAKHQVEQRQIMDGANLLAPPVISDFLRHRLFQISS